MAEIVNLRQARKRLARAAAADQADANRTAFGLPKRLREAAKTERETLASRLDGRRLGKPQTDAGSNGFADTAADTATVPSTLTDGPADTRSAD